MTDQDQPDRLRERIPLVSTQYGFSEKTTEEVFKPIGALPPEEVYVSILVPDITAEFEWHVEQSRVRDPMIHGTYINFVFTRKEGRCDEYPH